MKTTNIYNPNEKTFWHIQVTKRLNNELLKAIQENGFSSKSDFVRDAVRRRLDMLAEKA